MRGEATGHGLLDEEGEVNTVQDFVGPFRPFRATSSESPDNA